MTNEYVDRHKRKKIIPDITIDFEYIKLTLTPNFGAINVEGELNEVH